MPTMEMWSSELDHKAMDEGGLLHPVNGQVHVHYLPGEEMETRFTVERMQDCVTL